MEVKTMILKAKYTFWFFLVVILLNAEHFIRFWFWVQYGKENYDNRMMGTIFKNNWSDVEILRFFNHWNWMEVFTLILFISLIIFYLNRRRLRIFFKERSFIWASFLFGQALYFVCWNSPIYSYLFD